MQVLLCQIEVCLARWVYPCTEDRCLQGNNRHHILYIVFWVTSRPNLCVLAMDQYVQFCNRNTTTHICNMLEQHHIYEEKCLLGTTWFSQLCCWGNTCNYLGFIRVAPSFPKLTSKINSWAFLYNDRDLVDRRFFQNSLLCHPSCSFSVCGLWCYIDSSWHMDSGIDSIV
jgi:hypothetical protein